jgi:hypothetical protein
VYKWQHKLRGNLSRNARRPRAAFVVAPQQQAQCSAQGAIAARHCALNSEARRRWVARQRSATLEPCDRPCDAPRGLLGNADARQPPQRRGNCRAGWLRRPAAGELGRGRRAQCCRCSSLVCPPNSAPSAVPMHLNSLLHCVLHCVCRCVPICNARTPAITSRSQNKPFHEERGMVRGAHAHGAGRGSAGDQHTHPTNTGMSSGRLCCWLLSLGRIRRGLRCRTRAALFPIVCTRASPSCVRCPFSLPSPPFRVPAALAFLPSSRLLLSAAATKACRPKPRKQRYSRNDHGVE